MVTVNYSFTDFSQIYWLQIVHIMIPAHFLNMLFLESYNIQ